MPLAERTSIQEARYTCLWEYEVSPGMEREFLTHYAPGGSWTRLFERSPGYLATELYRDRERSDRFVTLDHWRTRAAYLEFLRRFSAEYETLDRACERLTRRETRLAQLERVTGCGPAVHEP